MPWIAPTTQNVLDRWNDAENSKFSTLLHSTGSPLPGIMGQVTEDFRGAYGIRYSLGPPGTIDSSGLNHFIAISRWLVINSLAGQSLQSPARKDEYETALKYLEDVREGKIRVAIPPAGTVVEASQTSGSPAVAPRHLEFTVCREDGI